MKTLAIQQIPPGFTSFPVEVDKTISKTIVLETLDGTHRITISGAMEYEEEYSEYIPATQGEGPCINSYPIGAKITLPSG